MTILKTFYDVIYKSTFRTDHLYQTNNICDICISISRLSLFIRPISLSTPWHCFGYFALGPDDVSTLTWRVMGVSIVMGCHGGSPSLLDGFRMEIPIENG